MVKEKLISFITAGRVNEALERLMLITRVNDIKLYDDLIQLSARLNANNSLFNQGFLKYDELKLENNKIYSATIDYINEIGSSAYFNNITLEDIELKAGAGNEEKIKILFIGSNPIDTPKFQIEKEYLEIRQIFNKKREKFEVIELFRATIDQLFEVIRLEKPDILHISAPSTDQYLILHRSDDTVRSIPYHLLSSAFTMFQPFVKCVFINTWCSPVFLKRISIPLQCAIGSKSLVDDNMSILFSSGFYTAIYQGKKFDEAFSIGLELLKNHKEYSARKIPFVIFKNGFSGDPADKTPECFDIEEPDEITKILNNNRKNPVP